MTTPELIRQLLINIGEDPTREGLLETPKRVAKAHEEFFAGYQKEPAQILKTFDAEGYSSMIVVKDIEYHSHCEHHLVPFFGTAHIAYIPDQHITGLSKLPRLVEVFTKRLQNQERLTTQIAETLFESLSPKGVAVQIDGRHLCMCSRGVGQANAETVTSQFLGAFEKDVALRQDFYAQIN